ncbi:MAG: hypothetical protein HY395_01555 [Candidatus Doudnabacteria bacterium]|nr:hypothetical protein [Candidatus Doudnabacteria bacterium]
MKKINRNATEVLSISLPKQLKRDVIKYAQGRDITVSQATKNILQSYILRERMERLQKLIGPKLRKLGIKTYEDVEKYFG